MIPVPDMACPAPSVLEAATPFIMPSAFQAGTPFPEDVEHIPTLVAPSPEVEHIPVPNGAAHAIPPLGTTERDRDETASTLAAAPVSSLSYPSFNSMETLYDTTHDSHHVDAILPDGRYTVLIDRSA